MRKIFSRRAVEIVCIVLVFSAYLFLKRANLHFLAGDQGVYFYAGSLWAQGILPYRDFFISHPPLQLLVPALFIKFFGIHLTLLNLLPALFGVLSGIVLLRLAWRTLGSTKAIVACVLFLLSYANLLSTLYYTGQNLALLLLLIACLLFFERWKFLSGFMLGLAQMVGVHILFPVAALSLVQFFWNRRKLPFFLGGFFLSSGSIHLLFTILTGKEFWRMIYLYHLAKPDSTPYLSNKGLIFWQMLDGHSALFLLALIGGWILYRSLRSPDTENTRERQRLLVLASSIFSAYFLFLGMVSPIFPHYFVPLVPFAALLASETLVSFLGIFIHFLRERRRLEATVLALPLTLLLLWSVVRTLDFYGREQRIMAFDRAEEIAERVERELQSEETLYGDFNVAPIVALLSGRRIADNEVDSSVMRFASGMYNLTETIANIEGDHLKAILTRSQKDIAYYPPFNEYLEAHFRLAETFSVPGRGFPVELWLRW